MLFPLGLPLKCAQFSESSLSSFISLKTYLIFQTIVDKICFLSVISDFNQLPSVQSLKGLLITLSHKLTEIRRERSFFFFWCLRLQGAEGGWGEEDFLPLPTQKWHPFKSLSLFKAGTLDGITDCVQQQRHKACRKATVTRPRKQTLAQISRHCEGAGDRSTDPTASSGTGS